MRDVPSQTYSFQDLLLATALRASTLHLLIQEYERGRGQPLERASNNRRVIDQATFDDLTGLCRLALEHRVPPRTALHLRRTLEATLRAEMEAQLAQERAKLEGEVAARASHLDEEFQSRFERLSAMQRHLIEAYERLLIGRSVEAVAYSPRPVVTPAPAPVPQVPTVPND